MAALAILALAGCSGRGSLLGGESARYGPRVVQQGQPVPKGGGGYKLGSPYHDANGHRYVPREEPNYDRTGIASWYGADFHGRRTANGEVYDMEALTVAHPTLPLPSYVRVTNPRNGRSLVARLNDRGPYVDGRIIDLSWGVASLLQLDGAGTGPVRVQYIGPAPLNGDDTYERRTLARQPWAGEHVASAASPAKALRSREATATPFPVSEVPERQDLAMAGSTPGWRTGFMPAGEGGRQTWPTGREVSEMPETRTSGQKIIYDRLPPAAPVAERQSRQRKPAAAHASLPAAAVFPPSRGKVEAASASSALRRTAAVQSKSTKTARPHTAAAAQCKATPARQTGVAQAIAKPLYVEAGVFPERATADRLAGILKDIAPAEVELTMSGSAIVHRLRLGPFTENEKAQSVIARIRGAGLTRARLLAAHEI